MGDLTVARYNRPGRARPGHGALEQFVPHQLGSAIALGLGGSAEALTTIARSVRERASVDIVDIAAAARPAVISALWLTTGGQFLIWTSSADSADRLASDCAFYLAEAGSPVQTLRPRDERNNALVNPTERADRLIFLAVPSRRSR